MKIETKYNLDDICWFMIHNVLVQIQISAIYISRIEAYPDLINYSGKSVYNPVTWLDHQNIPEDMLFKSKIELFESL